MSTKKQKERKKKDREAKAKARVEARRYKIRQARRDEFRARKLDMKFREKIKPVVNDPEKRAELEALEGEKVKQRLERNMQILKALEDEYESEQNRKKEFNAELESQGHQGLKEKLEAMEKDVREVHGEDSAAINES